MDKSVSFCGLQSPTFLRVQTTHLLRRNRQLPMSIFLFDDFSRNRVGGGVEKENATYVERGG
jgi:hypothetical protein